MSAQNSLGYKGWSIPVGTILPYAGAFVPDTFLLCDGATYYKQSLPDLYQVIGDIYTAVPNDVSFNLPNLVNYYPEGTNVNANVVTPAGTCEFELDLQEENMPSLDQTNFIVDTTEGAAGTGSTPVICKNIPSNMSVAFNTGSAKTKNANGSDVVNVSATISAAKNATNTPRQIEFTGTLQNIEMMYIIKAYYY